MRLEKPEAEGGALTLTMSPLEWKELHALAKFGQAGLAYDCKAAYVAQVFNYLFLVSRFGFSRPEDILADKNTQAALAALDRLAEEIAPGGGVNLTLRKEAMRQLLVVVGKASESEEQANLISDAFPEAFPYRYPDLEYNGDYYADVFERLLTALDEDQSIEIARLGAR